MPMSTLDATSGTPEAVRDQRYRLPGITREGIAQLSLLETALWPLRGGVVEGGTFETAYSFAEQGRSREARVSVYSPHGLQSVDEYVLWGLLGICLSRKQPEPTLLATPYWMIKRLGMSLGGCQYDQLRASLERLAAVAYQNTAFYNPVTQQHERVTLHFFSSFLPTRGRGGPVDAERAWRIEWSPMFFSMCQATGGSLLFDLDLYRQLSPGARRLFLKLKDRFWRSKRVFLNVDDLTIHGLGFSADRPLKKRKFDLTACIRELLEQGIIELGRGQSGPQDLFLKRGKGLYVVQFFAGPYFRQPLAERTVKSQQKIGDDPLYEPLQTIGVDEAGIRRLFKQYSRGLIQRWIRITDAALHEKPRGFPGFRSSPAAFLIDGIQNERMPPDWIFAHEKEAKRRQWEAERAAGAAGEQVLRDRYAAERSAALQAFLHGPDGRARCAAYAQGFLDFTKRLFSKEGSGLRPACLIFIRYDEGADCRSSPHEPCDSKEKEGRSGGDRWDGGRVVRRAAGSHRRLVAGRSPPMAVGSRRLARRARPSTRLGKAAESATLRGAERRGLRRDRRVSDSLAFVPHDRRGYHPPVAASYRRPATPCPHYAGPAA